MMENEAKAKLEAYIECDKRKYDTAYEKQCHEDCDNCNLCYAQGTVKEFREAMNTAIKALEKLEKIKEEFRVWNVDTHGYFGADDETTNLISALKNILKNDEG